jgi:heme-degrading monooxygenase HmoA
MTGTPRWHLAQLNVAKALFPLDDPRIAEFMEALDGVNALADGSPGFVWRLQSDQGNATDIRAGDDPSLIVNMSVWESAEALFDYVYKTPHRLVMARRREWFARPAGAYQVLWWVEAGHRPTVEEGLERLRRLDARGPTAGAFTFKQKYPPPGSAGPAAGPRDLRPEPHCVGWR